MITGGLPRHIDFHMDDTPLDMKKKIFNLIQYIFKNDKPPSEQEVEEYENWINNAIYIEIKDNTPHIKSQSGYSSRKAECEFCGRRHNQRDDMCEIKTDEYPNGNNLEEGGRQIKLRDLYDKIQYPRDLRFEVSINKDLPFAANALTINRQYDDNN